MVGERIDFIVHHNETICEIVTYKNEYNSLMELLYDKLYTDGFGECGGMGRCATCVVKIEQLADCLTDMERNEQTTLTKMGITATDIRLSCQVMITKALRGAIIYIL